jgi:hypothetical protein
VEKDKYQYIEYSTSRRFFYAWIIPCNRAGTGSTRQSIPSGRTRPDFYQLVIVKWYLYSSRFSTRNGYYSLLLNQENASKVGANSKSKKESVTRIFLFVQMTV